MPDYIKNLKEEKGLNEKEILNDLLRKKKKRKAYFCLVKITGELFLGFFFFNFII